MKSTNRAHPSLLDDCGSMTCGLECTSQPLSTFTDMRMLETYSAAFDGLVHYLFTHVLELFDEQQRQIGNLVQIV